MKVIQIFFINKDIVLYIVNYISEPHILLFRRQKTTPPEKK